MSQYSIFRGWFSLKGTRGRISFLLASIVSYFLLSILYFISFSLGFASILVTAFSGSETLLNNTTYILIGSLGLLTLINVWIITCIEIQRLRDIGLNGFIIFLVLLVSYILWIIWSLASFEIPYNGTHWSGISLLVIALFELFMPPSKKDEIKMSKNFNKSDNINQNKVNKRIDPTL